ncbi:MAG: hypothetical protein CFE40_05950 [Burkholderiales bacterium PBB1]|nr:MAG: hypothetical protein CFE40_05950 [Burkholderiales bacterium PBB1]
MFNRWLPCWGLAVLAGCAAPPSHAPGPVTRSAAPQSAAVPAAEPVVAGATKGATRLSPPGPVRSASELHQQAARRIVAANPQLTYMDRPPDVLLAIPVLAIDLNADGSIHRIDVLRPPRQAKDTIQIAIDAVYRAAPFGDVSRLPRPWRITETFLFNDDRRFKPRTLNSE